MIEIKKKGKQYHISITRGDSAYIAFTLTDEVGAPITITSGDTIRCQVRTEPNGGELLFSGRMERDENDDIVWHIRPQDTKNLEIKTYVWDCEVEFASGDIYTFIPKSNFTITDEVTEVG